MKTFRWFAALLVFLAAHPLIGAPPSTRAHPLPPPPGAIPYVNPVPFAPAHVGQTFSYQIDASDAASFAVDGLPSGLSVDTASGLISGVPLVTGTFTVTLSAIDSFTSTSISLALTVGPALPMVDLKVTRPLVVAGSSDHGAVKISRTGDLTQALTVSLAITGSAVNGTDYKPIGHSLVLAPNQVSANLRIVPEGSVPQGTVKTFKLTLVPESTYQVGSVAKAKVKIVPGSQ